MRLILVGDPNQLPPIGPGRPFADIIESTSAIGITRPCVSARIHRSRSFAEESTPPAPRSVQSVSAISR